MIEMKIILVLSSLLVSLPGNSQAVSCPRGFHGFRGRISGYQQCFKLIGESMSWQQAWGRCEREGLVLARPSDDIVIDLRKKLIGKYLDLPWVSGRGTGSVMSWRSGPDSSSSSRGMVNQHLIWPEYRGHRVETTDCLALSLRNDGPHPTSPYEVWPCTGNDKVLCQGNGWGRWSSWGRCSESCGGGEQERSRSCNGGNGECVLGETEYDTRSCNTDYCPVNGAWSGWSSFTSCSASCGTGSRQRSRACNNPPPSHGGRRCGGRNVEIIQCNEDPCPGNGCVFGDTSYPDKATTKDHSCLIMQCNNGHWEHTGQIRKECGHCTMEGASHSAIGKPISYQHRYEFSKVGNFVITQHGLTLGVNASIQTCNTDGDTNSDQTCVTSISYYEPGIVVKLDLPDQTTTTTSSDCTRTENTHGTDTSVDRQCKIKVKVESELIIGSTVKEVNSMEGNVLIFEYNHINRANLNCMNVVGSRGLSVSLCQYGNEFAWLYVYYLPALTQTGLCHTVPNA